mgnify:FL=1
MRKVKVWLVTEVMDWADEFVELPVVAFQSLAMAVLCKERRDRRAKGAEYPTWHEIHEIEVVLDD